eukprot:scaffold2763_cov37-Prasinocladus_malaysianus.AAC.2
MSKRLNSSEERYSKQKAAEKLFGDYADKVPNKSMAQSNHKFCRQERFMLQNLANWLLKSGK